MAKKPPFKRYEIPGLVERPAWWRVRVEEITADVQAARKGQARQIATTPYGFPVWAVAYNYAPARPGTAVWASASNSRNVAAYKTNEAGPQVVTLVCGTHAAEAEAIAGAMNLIALLETGRDLRGQARPKLVDLIAKYRFIILPCVNMDGRAVSPDHLRGSTQEQFVKASQGSWTDGTNIGYPACKEYSPLPLDRVSHPGGYPNGDGYNIQHDACPGDLRTDEARGMLRLVAEEQADLILHMHSHSIGGQVLGAALTAYPLHVTRSHAYKQRIHDALESAGLRPAPVHKLEQRGGLSITAQCSLASGGLSFVFEQSATADWSFDEMLETFYVTVETVLEWGQQEPFSPRAAVARGKAED